MLVDRDIRGLEANYVGVDNEEVGRIAVAHLVECGCRRIAHIRGAEISTAIGRLNGYRAAIRERGLLARPDYVIQAASVDDLSERSGYEAMQSLMALKPTPDAVFCYNDSVAVGAMSAIFQAKLSVPEDIAVLGVGDIPQARLLRVPLTSFDQKSDVVGEQAAQLVLKLVRSIESHPPARILLKPSLVVRRSTAGFRGLQNLSRWGGLQETGGM